MGLKMLDDWVYSRSICSVPVSTGSKLVMAGPLPRVELTNPPVPVPAPPEPALVPPVPEPTDPLRPPVPPPGVPETVPLLTPSVLPPAVGAENVGVGDVQVIALDGDVEVVLHGEGHGVIHRQDRAFHRAAAARSAAYCSDQGRHVLWPVRGDRIGEVRARLGVVLHRETLRFWALRRRLIGLGRGLGPGGGGQGTGQDDRKSPPEGTLQCRQKHSILSLQKLMMKSAKASGNQAMVRKIRAPGFIFVLTGAISASCPWARIE